MMPDDAGGVDERGLGMMPVDEFRQGPVEFLLAAENHVLSWRSVEKLRRCSSGPEDKAPRISQV